MKTILEISRELGVSKSALQKRISRGSLYTRLYPHITVEGGTKFIDNDGETIIKEAYSKVPPMDASIDGGMDTGIDGYTRSTPPEIQALIEQLAAKDRQIIELNNRLAETSAALLAAQKSVESAMLLHAGTMQARLLDGESRGDGQAKKGFWKRLFGKRQG